MLRVHSVNSYVGFCEITISVTLPEQFRQGFIDMISHEDSCTPSQSVGLAFGYASFRCWISSPQSNITQAKSRYIYVLMMTSSNGNISALMALCEENSPVAGEFHSQRPVTRSLDVWSAPWINGRVNNGEAGDLRCNRAHYDVIAMCCFCMHVLHWYISVPRHCFRMMY